jgi:hypothetical protein
MRWLAVWLLLTGVYFAGQLATSLLTGGGWNYSRENLAHLATVPLIQVVALRVVALVRRDRRRRRASSPRSPAAEKPASRQDAGR